MTVVASLPTKSDDVVRVVVDVREGVEWMSHIGKEKKTHECG